MKKIYLLFLGILFLSCNKTHCWECTINKGKPDEDFRVFCGMTKSQFKTVEEEQLKGNTYIEDYDCKRKKDDDTYCWQCIYRKFSIIAGGYDWYDKDAQTIDTCNLTIEQVDALMNPSTSHLAVGDTMLRASNCKVLPK